MEYTFNSYYITKHKRKSDDFDTKKLLCLITSLDCLQKIAEILNLKPNQPIKITDITAEQHEAIQALIFNKLASLSQELAQLIQQATYPEIYSADTAMKFWATHQSIEDIKILGDWFHIFTTTQKYHYLRMD